MKTLMKTILVSIPALLIAATITMVGCGDDTTTQDLSTTVTKDMAAPVQDLAKKD